MQPSKTYVFKVVVEPDEDRWHAYALALKTLGGATWGYTREETRRQIDEVVCMVVEGMIEDGEPIPDEPSDEVAVFPEIRVAVIV